MSWVAVILLFIGYFFNVMTPFEFMTVLLLYFIWLELHEYFKKIKP